MKWLRITKQRVTLYARPVLFAGFFTAFAPSLTLEAGAAPQPVKIAYASITQFLAGLWSAKEIGAFEKQGLSAELVYISSGGIATAALLGGGLDMALPATNAVVHAALAGAPLVAVGSQTDRPGLVLWAQPEIKNIGDFEGRTLGITRPGSLTHFLTSAVLRAHDLEGKVKLQPFGGSPEVAIAFNAGMIAGSLSGARPGPKAHALIRQLPVPFSQGLLVVTKDYYRDHPKAVEAMVQAYTEGVAAMRTDREFGLKVLRKYMRGRSEKLLKEDYESFLQYVIPVPRVDPAVIKTVLDWAGRTDVSPEKFFDNTIVDRMEKDGFTERLYRGRSSVSK